MKKVVARPFLGKEKYRNYKLCYVDDIPETLSELTEESKAWRKSADYRETKKRLQDEVKKGLRTSIYSYDSPLIYRVHFHDVPNPRFHKGQAELYAYFTDIPLSEQWGDDWDDAPYEHNAGDPYDRIFGKEPYTEHNIIIVPFYVSHDGYSVKLPRDYVYCNSPFCVRDINAGAVAWLFARDSSSRVAPGVSIHAGINPYEFFEKVDRINEMYPYSPDDE